MGPIDLCIYSLAAPRRTHPRTGVVHNATLKSIGAAYTNKTIDLSSRKVVEVTIPPATEREIADTEAVMGGEDWRMWAEMLLDEDTAAQMRRLFFGALTAGKEVVTDKAGRIRLDDREMRPEVQAEVAELWPHVTTENLLEISDFSAFERAFRNLFGFEVEGVDYSQPTETDLHW